MGMGVVVFDCDVSVFEIEDIVYERVEFEGGKGQWLAGELEFCLFDVVEIEVGIAECVYEFADLKSANLGCHVGKQGVGCYIEGYAEEYVGTALVKLA